MVDNSTVSGKPSRSDMQALFGPTLEFDKPLAPFTSYQTGGPARYYLAATSAEQLVAAIDSARKAGIEYYLVGGGSNLLVSDSGYDGLIIRVAVPGLSREGDNVIVSGAGESLMDLVHFATEQSLTGLEFAAGIWGSVGGALYGNAGAFGGEIGSVVSSLDLVARDGKRKTVDAAYCRFAYRDSYLKATGEVVTSARFQLTSGDKSTIAARVNEILAMREGKHPNDGKSAGCFFKNIPDASQPYGKLPAGKLLEEAGAKSLRVGQAKVFEKHANIIVNTGGATSAEIRQLADLMKQKVFERFAIELEEEVIQLGTF